MDRVGRKGLPEAEPKEEQVLMGGGGVRSILVDGRSPSMSSVDFKELRGGTRRISNEDSHSIGGAQEWSWK